MLFTVLSLLEILLINLFHTHLLMKKKYSDSFVFVMLFAFTFLIGLTVFFIGIKEETTIKAMLVGALYIFPLYLLYNMEIKKLFTIMVYCWTYTLMANTFAYGIVYLFDLGNISLLIFLIQTVLILMTFYFVVQFSRKKFKMVLQKANNKNQSLLIVFGVAIFSMMIVLRYYVTPHGVIFVILAFLVLIMGLTSYALMYAIVQSNLSLHTVNSIAYNDSLTGLKNRYSLFNNLHQKINEGQPFLLIFMDLDDLKDINDTYDHHMGDQYLQQFALETQKLLHQFGEVYRFAGDEFVCLVSNSIDQFEIEDFKDALRKGMRSFVQYNGVSIGSAYFPDDGMDADILIAKADKAMYGEKRSKKIRR